MTNTTTTTKPTTPITRTKRLEIAARNLEALLEDKADGHAHVLEALVSTLKALKASRETDKAARIAAKTASPVTPISIRRVA